MSYWPAVVLRLWEKMRFLIGSLKFSKNAHLMQCVPRPYVKMELSKRTYNQRPKMGQTPSTFWYRLICQGFILVPSRRRGSAWEEVVHGTRFKCQFLKTPERKYLFGPSLYPKWCPRHFQRGDSMYTWEKNPKIVQPPCRLPFMEDASGGW